MGEKNQTQSLLIWYLLYATRHFLCLILCEMIVIPTLQMWKLKVKEVKSQVRHVKAGIQDASTGLFQDEPIPWILLPSCPTEPILSHLKAAWCDGSDTRPIVRPPNPAPPNCCGPG